MSELPPNPHESDPVDELYRRASALDAGRPSESVRRAVLDHAAQLAARAAAQGVGENQPGVGRDQRRPARRRMWWKPAAFGTLAAAGLAGLLITPQFLTPRAPRMSTTTAARPRAQAREPEATDAAAPSPEGAAQGGAQSAAPIAAQNDAKSAPTEEQISVTAQRRAVASSKTVASSNAAASSKAPAADSLTAQGNLNGPVNYSEQSHQGQSDAQLAGNQSASGAVTPPAPALPATPAAPAAFAASKTPVSGLMDTGAQLRRSAEIGDVVALRALLDKQPAVDARDANGRTALMLATLQGRAKAVDMLLSAGADPNAADARGTTPLQAALAGNQSAIAAALRSAGAR